MNLTKNHIKNIFKDIKLRNCQLTVLPEGLYAIDNEKIKHSEELIKKIKFHIGSQIKLINSDKNLNFNIPDYSEYFEINLENIQNNNKINIKNLVLNDFLNEIESYKYDQKINPYENFLQYLVLKYFIISIKCKQFFLEGIWGEAKSEKVKESDLIEDIDAKELLKEKVNIILKHFPDYLSKGFVDHDIEKYNPIKSNKMSYLEYRILEIQSKIILQNRCMSKNLTTEMKDDIDRQINRIRNAKQSFPVVIV